MIKQTGDCIQCGGACCAICPANVFELIEIAGSYGHYEPLRKDDCIGCGDCVDACPGQCLTLEDA